MRPAGDSHTAAHGAAHGPSTAGCPVARWVEDAPLGGLWSPWGQVHWTVIEKVARRVGGKAQSKNGRSMLRQLADMLLTSPTVRDRVLLQLETEPPDRWPTSEDIVHLSQLPSDPDDWDFTPRGAG